MTTETNVKKLLSPKILVLCFSVLFAITLLLAGGFAYMYMRISDNETVISKNIRHKLQADISAAIHPLDKSNHTIQEQLKSYQSKIEGLEAKISELESQLAKLKESHDHQPVVQTETNESEKGYHDNDKAVIFVYIENAIEQHTDMTPIVNELSIPQTQKDSILSLINRSAPKSWQGLATMFDEIANQYEQAKPVYQVEDDAPIHKKIIGKIAKVVQLRKEDPSKKQWLEKVKRLIVDRKMKALIKALDDVSDDKLWQKLIIEVKKKNTFNVSLKSILEGGVNV